MRRGKKLIAAAVSAAMMFGPLGTYGTPVSYAAEQGTQVAIDATNFPDENFRGYVTENCDTDKDGNLSEEEISSVTAIDVAGSGIESLEGIEFFTALTSLNCGVNELSSLDVSKNTALTKLYCYYNNLSSLDVSGATALTDLNCSSNNLCSLDVSGATALTDLDCYDNNLCSLDMNSNTALTSLDCDSNNLSSLDVSKNTALTRLLCYNNKLSSLDVSKNTALTELNCFGNKLSSLDVSKNAALTSLDCGWNNLSSLDVSKNTALTDLDCHDNNLSSLDVSKNTALTELSCFDNSISSLDVSKNTALTYLDCSDNSLSSLDLSKNTELRTLGCKWNNLSSLNVSKNTELKTLDCNDNHLTITFSANNEFDMSTLIGMDVSKVSDITGGTIKGNILTVDSEAEAATYTYDCGNGKTAEFKLTWNVVAIDATNFPDKKFRRYVTEFDTDNDGYLSKKEISNVTSISVLGCGSLQGIGFFTALTSLSCFENNLSSLDVSKNTALTSLDCESNNLSSLDVSKNTALTKLNCGNNNLSSLDVSKNTALTYLYCWGNNLSSLDVSRNTALTELWCSDNKLSSLDVGRITALTGLGCSDNKLSSLDVGRNTALTRLYCYENNLSSLDVSKNTRLYELKCNSNNLNSLDVSKNTDLTYLHCYDNNLNSLDVSKNTDLTYLHCYDNNLNSLDVSKNTRLYELKCNSNNLNSLDVSKNIKLRRLYCSDNNLNSIDVSSNTLLEEWDFSNNTRTITLSADNKFDMSTLPGMDVSKIKGGTIKGNILTVDSKAKAVTYTYDCGNGKTAVFKLIISAKLPVTTESISSAAVTLPKQSYTYTGSAITPAVTITCGGKKLAAGKDCTVAYSNNKAVGTATVTITGKGSYTGTVTKAFTIVPASTTIKSLANATKGITVKWKRVSDAGGYYIYRSKNGGKYSRIKTVTSGKTVSYTDKSAKTNGAKYQYKIIAYKKIGKTIYKGSYSPVKTTYRISAPKIKKPSNKPGRKLAVKWAKNKRASGYQIQYATNSKFKSAKTVTIKKAATVSKVISKLKKNRTYSVRIRAYKTVSGKKYYSAWSSKKSVKIKR